jgi:tetratricopeptide (TPR) repeat protein
MSYLKNFTVATSGIANRSTNVIMGDIPALEQYTSHVPTIRVACLACEGDEPIAMGIWTVLRYALDQYEDIRTYPTYFDPQESSMLSFGEDKFKYFTEMKNNVILSGVLETTNDYSLSISMSGIFVEASAQRVTLQGATLELLLAQIPDALTSLVSHLKERTGQKVITLSPLRANTDMLTTIWDLEKRLLQSLILLDWDEDAFVVAAEKAISDVAKDESLAAEVIFEIVQASIFPPYSLTTNARKRLLDAILSSEKEKAIASLIMNLNQHGAAATALHLVGEMEVEVGDDVKIALADSALLNNDVHQAIETYQAVLKTHSENAAVLSAYANTLVYAMKHELLPLDFTPILSSHEDTLYEVIVGYEKAFELEEEAAHLLAAFQVALEYQHEDAPSLFVRLASSDAIGTSISSAIAALQDDEFVSYVDAVEQVIDDSSAEKARLLLVLAELYLAMEDHDASRECLEEYAEISSERDNRMRMLQLHSTQPNLEFQLSQFQQMNEQGKRLGDEQIDVLEAALVEYPWYSDGYLVLANGYVSRNDAQAAIEVLQDALTSVPDDPRLPLLLSTILKGDDQSALALETALEANKQFPYDLSMIAWIAKTLFDEGAEDEAKLYIQQAEMIAPTSRELAALRQHIGSKLGDS